MKTFLFSALLLLATTNSYAKSECNKKAFAVAKAVDAISNESKSKYDLVSATTIKSVKAGGETLDTIEVHIVADKDIASFWHVEMFSTACVIKSVRYVTGD